MVPSACTEPDTTTRHGLLRLTRESIAARVRGEPLPPAEAIAAGAADGVFVTLKKRGELRGCIGVMARTHALAATVQDCALGAAFRDPRFPPVTGVELAELHISISLLSPAEPLQVSSREELLVQLRPGVDGLILAEGRRSATFLPQVWEQLPEPGDFIAHLLRKAGLPWDYWSADMRCSRYGSVSFAEGDSPGR